MSHRKPKLFVTRELFPEVINELKSYFDVEVWDKYSHPSQDVLLEKVKVVDALVTLPTDRVDRTLLMRAEHLRIIAQYAVGYDNIDIECATRLGIYVTNTPDVLIESVAELTWALILAVARRVVESDIFVRWGGWERAETPIHPQMMLGRELKGKVLGVIGAGRIGSRVAEIGAKGFSMKVIYYSRSRNERLEKETGAEFRDIDELLEEADIVTIHVPLTKETRHLINEERLKRMKRTAILINTSRGAVVDNEALVKALKEGRIAGAGLDVFEIEPLPMNHPLTAFKNVVLTPHIGSATIEARYAMAKTVVQNLVEFYHGRIPPNLVNKDVVNVRPPGFSG